MAPRSDAIHPILVISLGGECMGVLVDEIVDVVEEPLEIQIAANADELLGTAEIRGEAVEILDVMHFIGRARPNAHLSGAARRFKVLLVDDKLFFRDMLAPVLTSGGYDVIGLRVRDGSARACSNAASPSTPLLLIRTCRRWTATASRKPCTN